MMSSRARRSASGGPGTRAGRVELRCAVASARYVRGRSASPRSLGAGSARRGVSLTWQVCPAACGARCSPRSGLFPLLSAGFAPRRSFTLDRTIFASAEQGYRLPSSEHGECIIAARGRGRIDSATAVEGVGIFRGMAWIEHVSIHPFPDWRAAPSPGPISAACVSEARLKSRLAFEHLRLSVPGSPRCGDPGMGEKGGRRRPQSAFVQPQRAKADGRLAGPVDHPAGEARPVGQRRIGDGVEHVRGDEAVGDEEEHGAGHREPA